jgi:hypothetical protein
MPLPSGLTSTKRLYWLGTLVVVIGLAALFSFSRHNITLLKATSHQREPYTELYFASPNNLPTSAMPNALTPLSFVIHNETGQTTSYSYEITFTSPPGQTTLLDEQKLTLASNAARVLAENLNLPPFSGSGELNVSLSAQAESIHLWLESAP